MDNGESSYRRFLDGDEKAFDEIIEEHRDGLTFFIDRYLHDEGESEDIAIDVFTQLLLYPHRYNFKTSLKTYLYMMGRSRALDALRRRRRFTNLQTEFCGQDASSPLEEFVKSERARAVHSAIKTLPYDMRAAVHLVYFEGLSYEETARVLHKSKKQVDNLLYRAKALLRTVLGKEGELFYANDR